MNCISLISFAFIFCCIHSAEIDDHLLNFLLQTIKKQEKKEEIRFQARKNTEHLRDRETESIRPPNQETSSAAMLQMIYRRLQAELKIQRNPNLKLLCQLMPMNPEEVS
jgi:hypothetical protein